MSARDARFSTANGNAILTERSRLPWSQRTLAAQVGVTPVALFRWESGGKIRHSNLRTLARVLKVNPKPLVAGDQAEFRASQGAAGSEARIASLVVEEIKDWLRESIRPSEPTGLRWL